MADDLIDQFDASEWPISQLSFNLLLGEMVEGGADTSAASLRTLILALVAYPECQKKAQEQIDAVCGTQRSPNWSDFDRLPYVNMLVKEGLRWRPVYVPSDPSLPSGAGITTDKRMQGPDRTPSPAASRLVECAETRASWSMLTRM